MQWQASPYTYPLIISAFISAIIAWYSWQHRFLSGIRYLSLLMIAVFLWITAYIFEINSLLLTAKLFWAKVEYIGIVAIPLCLLFFTTQFTKRSEQFQRLSHHFLLLIVPLITLTAVWTNDIHGLIWAQAEIIPINGIVMMSLSYGALFWIHSLYSYCLIFISSFLLIQNIIQSTQIFRGQNIALLLGILVPWITNSLYIFNLSPFPGLDLTPFGFLITGAALIWGTLNFKLFTIIPVAHHVVMQNLNYGVVVLDNDNRIIYSNLIFMEIFKFNSKNTIGKQLVDLCTVFDEIVEFSQNVGAVYQEFNYKVNGAQLLLAAQIIPLTNQKGMKNGRLLTVTDITQAKQDQIRLEEARQQSETAKQQIELALQKSEAASLAKSSFLNTMSHEIRTPLGAVIGMSNLLKDTPLNAEQKELVTTIITNSDTLLVIFNNVLEYAKIESGDLKLNRQSFDLRNSIEISLKPYMAAAAKKSVAFDFRIDENTPNLFYGDPIRLRQILSNLLDNAVKYTNEGEIILTVAVKEIINQQIELLFTIKDSGIGIPDSFADQMFQPFSQADAYMTRKYGGAGLGLAICNRLSQLMGGRIWAESCEGSGSTFYFTAVLEKSEQQPSQFLQPQTPTLRDKRLLIVAQNAQHRRIISRETRLAGMSPYVAGSLSEVNYWLNGSQFDVAIIDAQLLDEDTPDLITQIQNLAPNMPLILLLPTEEQDDVNDDPRISAYLNQPIVASTLYDILVSTLIIRTSKHTHAHTIPNGTSDMGQRHPLRLLMVEDNKINQKVGKRLLQRLGYEIDIAPNGAEGVKALEQKTYDVILMDIQMPIMDGVEATRHIREHIARERQPRIIAVTAHAMQGDKEDYLAAGMDDYISKPLQMDSLIAALIQCESL
ncbi:MAG: response regulator [Anaerolineales bacterium]|nr:response regulator [Anaerolineales bacterium]MCA9931363.1 response regulator [Anaerolineales bacterium]